MKLTACLLVLAVSLCAAPLALAQNGARTERVAVAKGRVQLLGADMAAICRPGDIERAHKLADACEGKQQCSFTPEPGDAAGEACARDSMALWDCGDGKTRYAALAPQGASQSREIKLECAPSAVATAAPVQAAKPPAAGQTAAPDKIETVKADELKLPDVGITASARNSAAIDMSAAGISRERARMVCELWTDPSLPEDPGVSFARLHANIWNKPDHSAGAAATQCGAKSPVPQSALPQE